MTSSSATPRWTPEQSAAIALRGAELLVSAAAGSGKTAVLTERVFQIISVAHPPAAEPVPLERLLVITFTRKAAREMRDRIERRIRNGLALAPDSPPLRNALDALPRASIMTLDAFCDRLVRRHFHHAGISPDVRIAEASEEREIAGTAAALVFEELSATREPEPGKDEASRADDFANLLASTPRGRESETATLMARIQSVRDFMASLDDPARWCDSTRKKLQAIRDAHAFTELPHLTSIAAAMASEARELADLLFLACDAALGANGAMETVQGWRALAFQIRSIASAPAHSQPEANLLIESLYDFLEQNVSVLEKLDRKGICGAALHKNQPLRENLLKKVAGKFQKFREQWFALLPDDSLQAEKLAANQALALLDLALTVEQRVQEIKRRRGVLGFADMARTALNLLTDASSGGPSEISNEYRNLFDHVLVDEYQDISPLQDAIIRKLARAGSDYPADERNLFMVGDIKQSVYRFRRAEPALFARRLDAHGKGDPALARINLRSNFRSRPGVLHGVNAICARLMDRAVGGVDYDDDARLYPSRDEPVEDPVCVEARWILAPDSESAGEPSSPNEEAGDDSDGDSATQTLTTVEREAAWIARRIRELTHPVDGMKIPDEKTGRLRLLRPGDCAILVRNLKSDRATWIRTLARHGLRVRGSENHDELNSLELSDLLAALRLADNPFDDYSLATVLRSPMFALTDDDLLRIRMIRREGPFHAAFWLAAGRDAMPDTGRDRKEAAFTPPPELTARCREVASVLDLWRTAAERSDAESVLDVILKTTRYESHVAGLPGADARMALIRGLRDVIRSHATRQGGSLSEFLAFHAANEARASDPGEEEELEDDDAAVRLMTIHKSKGLEFPVVFYARLASEFNKSDIQASLQISSSDGIAMEAVDLVRRLRIRTPGLLAMQAEETRQVQSEELRLIYVAMTRARERLVLVGTHHAWKDENRVRERWRNQPMSLGDTAPVAARIAAASAADLLAPSLERLSRNPDSVPWLSCRFEHPAHAEADTRPLNRIRQWVLHGDDAPMLRRADAISEYGEVFSNSLHPTAPDSDLPFPTGSVTLASPPLLLPSDYQTGLSLVPVKVFASSLRREAGEVWMLGEPGVSVPMDDIERNAFADENGLIPAPLVRTASVDLPEPAFVQARAKARMDAAAIGTHVHAILRHLDLTGALDESGLRKQASELRARGLLEINSDDLLDELGLDDVAWFFATRIGRLMRDRPGSILRELPFRRWIRARDLHARSPDGQPCPLAEQDSDDRILVQGVIDCVIDAGNEIIILDYKTDRARDPGGLDALVQHHYAQIDTYRSALRAIWRVSIHETALVFLRERKIVTVPDPTA